MKHTYHQFVGYTGVYRIGRKETNQWYVGSSANIGKRIRNHLWHLRRKSHYNKYLLNAWQKYGEGAFVIEVVETCAPSKLFEREQFHLNRLKGYGRGYNLTRSVALYGPLTEENRRGRSERAKKQHREKNFGIHTWTKTSRKKHSNSLKKAWARK